MIAECHEHRATDSRDVGRRDRAGTGRASTAASAAASLPATVSTARTAGPGVVVVIPDFIHGSACSGWQCLHAGEDSRRRRVVALGRRCGRSASTSRGTARGRRSRSSSSVSAPGRTRPRRPGTSARRRRSGRAGRRTPPVRELGAVPCPTGRPRSRRGPARPTSAVKPLRSQVTRTNHPTVHEDHRDRQGPQRRARDGSLI